jgi:hypothetical protein
MAIVSTRIPERFQDPLAAVTAGGIWAWTLDGDGNLVPSGASNLTAGQAWEYDGDGNLVPTGQPIVADPFWQYDGDGNLVARNL